MLWLDLQYIFGQPRRSLFASQPAFWLPPQLFAGELFELLLPSEPFRWLPIFKPLFIPQPLLRLLSFPTNAWPERLCQLPLFPTKPTLIHFKPRFQPSFSHAQVQSFFTRAIAFSKLRLLFFPIQLVWRLPLPLFVPWQVFLVLFWRLLSFSSQEHQLFVETKLSSSQAS